MPSLFARRLGSLITGSLAVLFGATAATAQIPCAYEVTAVIQPDPCPFTGFPPTIGTGLSDLGHAVGYYRQCNDATLYEAFVWTPETGLMTLDRPPGYISARAWDIDSARGWIVGSMEPKGTNLSTAALWVDGVPIDLGTLPGGNFSQARATAGRKIVGNWGNTVMGPIHGFIWEDGVMTDLGPILEADGSRAADVSTSGEIVGWLRLNPGDERIAYLLKDDVRTILGPIPGGFRSEAQAISSTTSQIVGVGRLIDDKTGDVLIRAFYWSEGKMIDIGTLPGFVRSGATDVQDSGVVIGTAWGGVGQTGFIWRDGVMADLNDLIPRDAGLEVTIPWAINSKGQITGQAHNDQPGDVVAFLLTPIESPVGDLDGDCAVDILDLLILLSNWGPCPGPPEPCAADLDGTGSVGIIDLLTLLSNWG